MEEINNEEYSRCFKHCVCGVYLYFVYWDFYESCSIHWRKNWVCKVFSGHMAMGKRKIKSVEIMGGSIVKKITARYFYAPICPESFASLDRLYNLFSNYKEQIDFEVFNVFDCKFESPHSWFKSEEEIIKSITGSGTYPLLYGALFIQ